MGFRFHDPGRLIDGELELIAPDDRFIDDILIANADIHLLDPHAHPPTRRQLQDLIDLAPHGCQSGDSGGGIVPTYHFWMYLHPARTRPLPRWCLDLPGSRPPLVIGGTIALRIGHSQDIEMYLGHIGYNVHPFARGNHYAERACRLLRPLTLRHGINPVWITCNPDNIASRRTCQRLGCTLVETVSLPPTHILRQRGDRDKCRYRWDL